MSNLKNHPFFLAIEMASKFEKKARKLGKDGKEHKWGGPAGVNRAEFLNKLRGAHPFVFDKKTTVAKVSNSHLKNKISKDIVKDFSIPFKQTLYLLSGATAIHKPWSRTEGDSADEYILDHGLEKTALWIPCGYLINEISPENVEIFQVALCRTKFEGRYVDFPYIDKMAIDLKDIERVETMIEAITNPEKEREVSTHYFKEINAVLHLTSAISVKRIGIEKGSKMSLKNKGFGTGLTVYKYPNIYHIADKREYEYVLPADGSDINWEWSGWWRGHWRAFYVKDALGRTLKDEYGRNVVDYGRIGKDRQGEYNTKGYTWVTEHIKGDARVAEIKTHFVKAGE